MILLELFGLSFFLSLSFIISLFVSITHWAAYNPLKLCTTKQYPQPNIKILIVCTQVIIPFGAFMDNFICRKLCIFNIDKNSALIQELVSSFMILQNLSNICAILEQYNYAIHLYFLLGKITITNPQLEQLACMYMYLKYT